MKSERDFPVTSKLTVILLRHLQYQTPERRPKHAICSWMQLWLELIKLLVGVVDAHFHFIFIYVICFISVYE